MGVVNPFRRRGLLVECYGMETVTNSKQRLHSGLALDYKL